MLTILIDPARLGTQASFEQEAVEFVNWLQAGPTAPGFEGVQIAGDPERATRVLRQVEGISVDDLCSLNRSTSNPGILKRLAEARIRAGFLHAGLQIYDLKSEANNKILCIIFVTY